MKRIVHFTSVHNEVDTRIFKRECRSLANAGYEVYWVVPNVESRLEEGVHIVGVPSKAKGRLVRMTKTVKRVLRKVVDLNPDVCHFHDPEMIPAALYLKRKGFKVIYDVHEDTPASMLSKEYINPVFRRLIAFMVEMLERFSMPKFDQIITATDHIKELFARSNTRIDVIYNFPFKNELIQGVIEDERKDAVIYVGGLTKIRGIHNLVNAIGKVKDEDVRLILGGGFTPVNYADELKALNGWKRTDYHGFVNREQYSNLLAKSFAGLVLFLPEPNHIEAMPNKIFEYMSAGLPIVCSHFPLWKQLVEENGCGICVDPEDPVAIAIAIEKLNNDRELGEEWGRKGRSLVEERFNWEQEEQKLIAIYNRLLNE